MGDKKTSFKSWARFFLSYIRHFLIFATKIKKAHRHERATKGKRSFKNIKIKSRIPKLKPLGILDLFLGILNLFLEF